MNGVQERKCRYSIETIGRAVSMIVGAVVFGDVFCFSSRRGK